MCRGYTSHPTRSANMEENPSTSEDNIQEGSVVQELAEENNPDSSDFAAAEDFGMAGEMVEVPEAVQDEDWDNYSNFNWMSDSSNTTQGHIPDPFLHPGWSGSQEIIPPNPPPVNVNNSPIVSFVPGTAVCELIVNTNQIPRGPIVVGPGEVPIFLVGRGTPPRYPRTLVLPARVEVNQLTAYVSIDGSEYDLLNFEILMVLRGQVAWVTCYGGEVPVTAIPVGRELTEPVYAARVHEGGRHWLGMVSSEDYAALVSINGVESIFNQYEVLVLLPNT